MFGWPGSIPWEDWCMDGPKAEAGGVPRLTPTEIRTRAELWAAGGDVPSDVTELLLDAADEIERLRAVVLVGQGPLTQLRAGA
jgi:hypothetical protein